jgi:hypothetical protein
MATKKQENAKIKKVKFVSIPDLCNVCNKNLVADSRQVSNFVYRK